LSNAGGKIQHNKNLLSFVYSLGKIEWRKNIFNASVLFKVLMVLPKLIFSATVSMITEILTRKMRISRAESKISF
jgi:hypothetical protein